MKALEKIISNLKNIKNIAIDILQEETNARNDFIEELNRQQLLEGKGNDNQFLSPKYTDDPYFKTKKAALGYAKWKYKIELKPKLGNKPFLVPNLYINGYTHSKISFSANKAGLNFSANDKFATKVFTKFKKGLGLNQNSLDKLVIIIRPTVYARITRKILS